MDETGDEYDVAIVGGGPAGCSAGVFTAREGLSTVIFDRGRSSIRRCAFLENYLGFPSGIDIEARTAAAHGRLASHLDPVAVARALDSERLLDAIDDEDIRAYRETEVEAQ